MRTLIPKGPIRMATSVGCPSTISVGSAEVDHPVVLMGWVVWMDGWMVWVGLG